MKKRILTMAFVTALSAPAFADICSDIVNQYTAMITRLEQDTMAAISQTTDPTLQQALMDSYNWQKQMLIQQEQLTLQSYGCTTTTTGTGTPTPTPTPVPTATPTPTPTTTPTVGGDPGTDPGVTSCDDEMEHMRTLTAGMPMCDKTKFLHQHKSEIERACGNYGRGNSRVRGRHDDDHGRGHDR